MIGSLDKRIAIQEEVLTPDGSGGFTKAWQNIATNPSVYAAIMPLAVKEQFLFQQMQIKTSHRIFIRYRDDITPAMQIVNGAKTYEINTISDINARSEYLEILVTEKE